MGIIMGLLVLALVIVVIAAMWKVFEKAGKPGWAAIIPFYNMWVMAEIVGKPGWFGLLVAIPYAGIVVAIYLYYLLAKSFGKGVGFAVGLVLLGIVFFPILGFGDAKYQGPPVDDILGKLEE